MKSWLALSAMVLLGIGVAALPAHSAIYYPTIRVDGRGVPQEGDALLLRFIAEDRAPIFTAGLRMRRRPLTRRSAVELLVRYPMLPLRSVAAARC